MKRIFTAFMMMLCAACVASAANYLTFTAAEEGSSFGIMHAGKNNPDVQYSLDDGATWNALTDGDSIPLAKKGDKALIRGNNPKGFSSGNLKYTNFKMSGKIAASGSVMSLIDGEGESLTIPNNNCFCYLFDRCESLVQAPELPATQLADSCYYFMFYLCANLEKAPELPATELAEYCYYGTFACCRKMVDMPQLPASVMVKGCYNTMFLGCYSMTEAPELPSTELANSCYANMFAYCIALKQAPELPATTVKDSCYMCMFSHCDSLTQAPALPATKMEYMCYFSMFDYCVSLEVAPELPATTLAEQCYFNMFSDCFSLKKAPDLPAVELVKGCYMFMFNSCSSLTEVKVHFTSWEYAGNSLWLSGVPTPGTFYCSEKLLRDTIPSDIPYGWTVKFIEGVDTTANYLTFTAEEDSSSCMLAYYNCRCPNVLYSYDGESWLVLHGGESIVLAKKGDKVMLSGYNPSGFSQAYAAYSCFMMTGKIAASGSVMSLVDGKGHSTEIPSSYCFYKLFSGCTSLTKAPELPATTLTEKCYGEMFLGCTSLSEIHVSFSDWGSDSWTGSWVKDVAPTGTFICPYTLPLRYGESWIPKDWAVKYAGGEANYLTFTAEEDGSTFGIINNDGNNPNIQYSLDGGSTWSVLTADDLVTLRKKGDQAMLRGLNPNGFSRMETSVKISRFKMTGKIAASGSVMSLVDGVGNSTVIPVKGCFKNLFSMCSCLTQAPELPATTLTDYCYSGMFSYCTGLKKVPALPATELAESCYEEMFKVCESLKKAPALPAPVLVNMCYNRMFWGCANLSEIEVSIEDWILEGSYGNTTYEWVYNVAPTGTFVCPKALPLEYGSSRIPDDWTVKYLDDTAVVVYVVGQLSFTAEEEESTFELVNNGNTPNVEYSKDGGKTWTPLTPGEPVVLDEIGETALLRGNNPDGFSQSWDNYSNFSMTGRISARGNVMSLLDGTGESTVIPNDYCFCRLFENCEALVKAPVLPATTLTKGCYKAMFMECVDLKMAPELPATTLADSCYAYMFFHCEDIGQTPVLPAMTMSVGCYAYMFSCCYCLLDVADLPATTLAESCYANMFNGCESLMNAPALPATTLKKCCYAYMFAGTTLHQAPELPATTLADSCYAYMFVSCNFPEAPKLPAMTLAEGCYSHMFVGCCSIDKTPELPATTLATGCYSYMFDDCSQFQEIPELPATTLAKDCYSYMFRDCYYLHSVVLPATTLAEDCYSYMFAGCDELSEVRVSFDQWQTADGKESSVMFLAGVRDTGTFYCPKALALEYGRNRIPSGWKVKYIEEEPNYLTFTAEEDNVSVAVTEGEAVGGDIQPAPYPQLSDESAVASVEGEKRPVMRRNLPSTGVDLKYSTDGGETWTEMVPGTPVTLVKKGDKILLKGNNPSGFSTETQRIQFDIEGTASASGSVMSLIDEAGGATTIPNEYCFASLFENCAGLTEMPDLSATELKAYCYKDMFRGCTSLTSTTELPATTLEEGSYEGMFYDCENLSEVSVSFSDWADGTEDWLHGVAPEGKVISPANLAPTVGDDYVPDGWALVPDSIITGVANALADGFTVWTDGLTVYVRGAKGIVSLYDASGRSLTSNYSADEERALSVPAKGVYVVRTNGGSSVVLVR